MLLVEDNPLIGMLVAETLRDEDIEVIEVSDADGALQALPPPR
jgi:DNA-binding response OmpR family regulator